MDDNKQREQMMDAALAFILSYGRDVQEAAIRKHLKAAFPMPNEREQSVWIMSTFSNLEELRAIRRTGSMVGVTRRGRMILRCGGAELYERARAVFDVLLPIFKFFSAMVAMMGVYFTARASERSALKVVFAVFLIVMSIGLIYSLLKTRRKRKA